MASPSTVITLGFGSFGSVNLLPTLGYGVFALALLMPDAVWVSGRSLTWEESREIVWVSASPVGWKDKTRDDTFGGDARPLTWR